MALNMGNYAGFGLLAGGLLLIGSAIAPEKMVAGSFSPVTRGVLGVGLATVGTALAMMSFK